jgi:hypothetical protein
MLHRRHTTPGDLRNIRPGEKPIVFYVGPCIEEAAKRDPGVRALRDVVEELLRDRRIVLLTTPAADHRH